MRVVFAGTPDFAVPCLSSLHDVAEVIAVYTQPDRPAGRGKKLQPGAVKRWATEHGIEVRQPLSLRDPAAVEALDRLSPDLMVVVAYGLLLPREVLDVPVKGCVNVHASLLPRWRGAAPIQRAIEAGDTRTGVTLMQMEAGLDSGPMLMTEALKIGPTENAGSLHDRLSAAGGRIIARALPQLAAGSLEAVRQDEAAVTYAAKLDKKESPLDWNLDAVSLFNKIRAFNPWPVASASLRGVTLRIHEAMVLGDQYDSGASRSAAVVLGSDSGGIDVQCGEGVLRILSLQKPGGRAMPVKDFLNGMPVAAGESFDSGRDTP